MEARVPRFKSCLCFLKGLYLGKLLTSLCLSFPSLKWGITPISTTSTSFCEGIHLVKTRDQCLAQRNCSTYVTCYIISLPSPIPPLPPCIPSPIQRCESSARLASPFSSSFPSWGATVGAGQAPRGLGSRVRVLRWGGENQPPNPPNPATPHLRPPPTPACPVT